MAEMLVKAADATHPDPLKDQRGCYKRGMPVIVMDDGHLWGGEELPLRGKFVLIKVPLIPKARLDKYIQSNLLDDSDAISLVGRRRWQIRWNDLPQSARDKLRTVGILVIKATAAYTGPFDFTWLQVKTFFRNLQTGLDETEDL